MRITGFQPVSLIDYPGIVCSIVFTQGCPFRCVYCHNPQLIDRVGTASISEKTIFDYLTDHAKVIEGVCVTGGEPTVHPDLPEFLRALKRQGALVKLDTNGVNPHMVSRVIREKLVDYVAMDIKHVWERYGEVIQRENPAIVQHCRQTMRLLQESGVAHEFRTTVYTGLHSEEDLIAMSKNLRRGEVYVLQQIRYDQTLDPNLPRTTPLNLLNVAEHIEEANPLIQVEVRC